MNKSRHLIATLCVLAMSCSSASRLKVKPSLSISLNKRSVNTTVENRYYLNSLAGSTGIITKFSTEPFGSVYSGSSPSYATNKYLAPALTYVDTNFVLKMTGEAQADAKLTDAVSGDKVVALLSSTDVTNLSEVATNGDNFIPILSAETDGSDSTLTFYNDLKASADGIISEIGTNAATYSYVTTGDDLFLKIDANGSNTFNNDGAGLLKYYTRDATKKYYLVIGDGSNNNFGNLVEYNPSSSDSNTYTQLDYEHIEFYGVTLALDLDYAITDALHLNLQTDITTPIESIEHTGKFVAVNPEADMGLKVGVSVGNKNGTIGYLYGIAYDRFTAHLKRFITPVGDNNYLERQNTQVKKFTTCQEITANISLTSQIDAHFSTMLTGSDFAIDINGSYTRAPVTDQRFSAGFTMNY